MRFWFRCSCCRFLGMISQDQADGHADVICGGCSLIRRGILGIRISSETDIDPATFRTWLDEPYRRSGRELHKTAAGSRKPAL